MALCDGEAKLVAESPEQNAPHFPHQPLLCLVAATGFTMARPSGLECPGGTLGSVEIDGCLVATQPRALETLPSKQPGSRTWPGGSRSRRIHECDKCQSPWHRAFPAKQLSARENMRAAQVQENSPEAPELHDSDTLP